MAMSYIDYGITIVVIAVVLGLFYKALKEPIDLVWGGIKRLLGMARDGLASGVGSGESTTVIRYG